MPAKDYAEANFQTLTESANQTRMVLENELREYIRQLGLELPTSVDVQEFRLSGTWTKPTSAKFVKVIAVSGGGGGGSGGKQTATNTVTLGGGGGCGGSIGTFEIPAIYLTATVAVTIGIGGAGASGVTVAGVGDFGGQGGASKFGNFFSVRGSGGAFRNSGGTGAMGYPDLILQTRGTSGGTSTPAGIAGEADYSFGSPTGGGPGAGITVANMVSNGSSSGAINMDGSGSGRFISGGGNGGSSTVPAGNGTASALPSILGGCGGGGGASMIGANGGNGGKGGFPGGGGGGGGATSTTGAKSGDGGQGGSGFVVVVTYF